MKFLVLALCVCAANAASFGLTGFGQTGFGQTGFGQTGFGQTGFGKTGFGQTSFRQPVVGAFEQASQQVVKSAVAQPQYSAQASASFSAPSTAPVVTPVAKTATLAYQPFQPAVQQVANNKDQTASITSSESDVRADGFKYSFKADNGISAQAEGDLKKVGDANVLTVQGAYSYYIDGVPVEVRYIADENGYRAESNLLPVAPPVPEAILRSIAYNAAHPAAPENLKKY